MYSDVKTPPYDLDVEEAVLGSILIDPEAMCRVAWLKPDYFYREKHRWVYECIQSLYEHGVAIDQITVANELAKRSQLEAAGGGAFLGHLVSQVPSSIHVEHYGSIVKKLGVKRLLIRTFNQVSEMAYDSAEPEEIIVKARELLDKIARTQGKSDLITPQEWSEFMLDRYSRLREKQSMSLMFDFPTLDSLTGGAFGGEFIVLGARPKMGKSTVLDHIARSFAKHTNVLIAQVEMSKTQMADRDVGHFIEQKPVRVRAGNYPDDMFGEIIAAIGASSEMKICRYVDGEMTTGSLRAVAYEMQDNCGVGAIIVDYLQILKDKPAMSAYEQTKHISGKLLGLCNDLDIPMVAASQLNREVDKRPNRRPQMSDFRESGTIEQDADVVLALYRADGYVNYLDPQCPPGEAELRILAHRQGASLKPIYLVWRKDVNDYGEHATKNRPRT